MFQVPGLHLGDAARRGDAGVPGQHGGTVRQQPWARDVGEPAGAAQLERDGRPDEAGFGFKGDQHRRAHDQGVRLHRLWQGSRAQGQARHPHAHTHWREALFLRSLR